MVPTEAPRRPQVGYLYLPPYRVQGLSIAGEESVVQVPELGVCFDIGRCPRLALTSEIVALTHGHMDHSAGIAYYFSQRQFQGMGVGTVVCHPDLERPIHNVMRAWVDLEAQRTPYKVVALAPDSQIEIKNNIFLRGFATEHRVPSLGFVIVEYRSKLKPELIGLPQEQLVAMKKAGQTITQTHEIPLVCYTGDTAWGKHFERADVLGAKVLITECTFTDEDHRNRAQVGMHLHLDEVARLVEASSADAVVLVHLSRRTRMSDARQRIEQAIPAAHCDRVHLLMDHRTNRQRLENQARQGGEDDGES